MSVVFFVVFLSLYTYHADQCPEFEVPEISDVFIFALF
jgi:hypothetical protein